MVKKSRHFNFDEVRQRFRLTPTERRVALFVAAAFVLGLITKCYRDAHPSPTPVQTHLGSSRTPASFCAKVDRPRRLDSGQIQRCNKSTSKSNNRKLISHTSCLRKRLFPQIIPE